MPVRKLEQGEQAFAAIRSDGQQVIVLSYNGYKDGDWFVFCMTKDPSDRDQRNAYLFRPVSVLSLTDEQYYGEEWNG